MNKVVSFDDVYGRRRVPPLVFVDVHIEQIRPAEQFDQGLIEPVLSNCRRLLDHARGRGWQLGFVTPLRPMGFRRRRTSFWIRGFEPTRKDMVFERETPSCYSSREFADAMRDAGGVFVLAGFSAESSGLCTLIDTNRHGHLAGLITDASATRPLPGRSAQESHAAVSIVASRYASLVTAERWTEISERIQAQAGVLHGHRQFG